MLPVPFSFSGRLGRWGYFKAGLALALSAIIPAFLAVVCYDRYRAGSTGAFIGGLALLATYGVAFFWICLTVTVRRIRDMGWSPGLVMTIWIAVELLDPVVAHFFPGLATGKHGLSTPIGGMVHLVLSLALMFWPSTSDDVGAPPTYERPPNLPTSRVAALQAQRSAPMAPVGALPGAPGIRPAFGRR